MYLTDGARWDHKLMNVNILSFQVMALTQCVQNENSLWCFLQQILP